MIDKREITPRILAEFTALLFTRVPFRDVLESRILYNEISAADVARIMINENYYSRMQSEESYRSLAHSVIDYVSEKTDWLTGWQENQKQLNVFDLLMLTLHDLLMMNQNQMECRYENIWSWRVVARYMGEELPVSARYAQWDHEQHKAVRNRYDEFSWSYVTAHNNKQLNALFRQGISDHHFHLWGSTPYFHISWVNLMNDLHGSEYQKNLRKLNSSPWSAEKTRKWRQNGDYEAEEEHFWESAQVCAAWIRLYLCERCAGIQNVKQRHADLKTLCSYKNWRALLLRRDRLQAELNAYNHLFAGTGDYALAIAQLRCSTFSMDYHLLIGERWLYYQIFRDYCKPSLQRNLTQDDYNLFFAYLLIRSQLRNQMVQSNDRIGFDNFQRIQGRKAYFLSDSKSERALARLAINEVLENKNYVRELEVRISPSIEQVKRLERYVNEPSGHVLDRFNNGKNDGSCCPHMSDDNDLRQRYYYVFHFIKGTDLSQEPNTSCDQCLKTMSVCRHDKQRRLYLDQANELVRFRERHPQLAQRILGIDAASNEIGCRPEVFGTVFRLLGSHQFAYGGYIEEKQLLPALGKTYHVGEEFPDIVNGLRAIDEVINFLDFGYGDRIGHAIVLGVDVEDWYEQRRREITVSVQDYLDDLAWLYHALSHFSIECTVSLRERIVRDFEYWFRIVYRNSIEESHIQALMSSAERWYGHTKEDHERYQKHPCHFDIMDYYRAWTLRGDDPQYYIDGYFKKPSGSSLLIPEKTAGICTDFPSSYEDRYIPEYSLLNYLYQFDAQVRKKGARKIKVDLSEEYIHAVKAVQIEMRYCIARRGIAIETNPTSNVLIGSFRKYEEHPILSFNNRGLHVGDKEEQECAQLQVSINTDDKGVFYTDLETEYAMLAWSVEQIMDENAKPRFKKTDVYAWLNNIREMGNHQTFRDKTDGYQQGCPYGRR